MPGASGSASGTTTPGRQANRQRARDLLAIALAEPFAYFRLTASVMPPVLESATSGESRQESRGVNRGLPAESELNRLAIDFRLRPGLTDSFALPSGDSFSILTAPAVDVIFAKENLEPALS